MSHHPHHLCLFCCIKGVAHVAVEYAKNTPKRVLHTAPMILDHGFSAGKAGVRVLNYAHEQGAFDEYIREQCAKQDYGSTKRDWDYDIHESDEW